MGGQTVREALDEKRRTLKGRVKSLVLCKRELFFVRQDGMVESGHDDTVFPVSRDVAEAEAKYYGVPWQEV